MNKFNLKPTLKTQRFNSGAGGSDSVEHTPLWVPEWVKSYLADRRVTNMVTLTHLWRGVPQGSIVEPILFSLHSQAKVNH